MLTDAGPDQVYLPCGSTDLRKWIDGQGVFQPALCCFGAVECSRPVLDEFHAWLEQQAAHALPKSLLGRAVQYCLNQWEKLTAFLKDGRLELDNNRSER